MLLQLLHHLLTLDLPTVFELTVPGEKNSPSLPVE